MKAKWHMGITTICHLQDTGIQEISIFNLEFHPLTPYKALPASLHILELSAGFPNTFMPFIFL